MMHLAMGEASTMMLQPPAAELLRNGRVDINRRMLDLNLQAFDLSDVAFFHAHRPSSFFETCLFTPPDPLPLYYLPFPPPSPDLWHHHLREYWRHDLFHHHLSKQELPSFKQHQNQQAAHPLAPNNPLPLASTSAHKPSPDLFAKYIIESPAWLPLGWITEVQTRRTGTTAGTKDKYYKDPVSGRRFRSRNEVYHFLETGKGRVRRRYKRRIMNPEGTSDAVCVTTKVLSPSAAKANITETGCQSITSLAYTKALESHSLNKDTSNNSLSVAFTIPPAKEKLPQEWQRPHTIPSSSAPESSADTLPPKNPQACRNPATTPRKRSPQERTQKAPEKKKVRFESTWKGPDRQDSNMWQWLQKPVGLHRVTGNDHQEKKLEQRLDLTGATMAGNNERPKESGRVVAVGNKPKAGLKCGFLRKKTKSAIDEELSLLIQKPGLTSRQRARIVQKFKARRAKQLLAVLGRKICCQLLGLPAR